jgi:uncharacterized protein (TIGR03118 family)
MKKIVGILVVLTLLGVSPVLAYTQTNLVSDIPGLAKITDPNLVNSWGITHPPTGPWWVADNGPGLATLYNGTGTPFPVGNPLIVSIPGINGSGTPTGIVFNGGSDFNITPGNASRFIFATEDGTIAAWNPNIDRFNAIQLVNNSPEAVYKGITIASNGGKSFLYVANFRQGSVDVFDTNFNKVESFTDPNIPSGFAPFNVLNINGNLVVTFAKQDDLKHDDVAGKGNGFVDLFDPAGNVLVRFLHGFWLNSPWGITKAPSNFGIFSGDFLIGQFGGGQIAAYDNKGNFRGLLRNGNGHPITIDGLWGLGFGNDANAGPSNTLFFAAGINHEQDGLFGTITK